MLTRRFQIFGSSHFILYIHWIILLGSMARCLKYNGIDSSSCCCTKVPDIITTITTPEPDMYAEFMLEATYTCEFKFLLNDSADTEPPVISNCPNDIEVIASNGSNVATASWNPPTATSLITTTHYPGDTFSVGLTSVTYTFNDEVGNAATCSFNVIVRGNPAGDYEDPCLSNPCVDIGYCTGYRNGFVCERGIYLGNLQDDAESDVVCSSEPANGCDGGSFLDLDNPLYGPILNTQTECASVTTTSLGATMNNNSLTVQMHICQYEFNEFHDESYYYILSNGTCPKTWNYNYQFPTEYCPRLVTVRNTSVPATVQTITNGLGATSKAYLTDTTTTKTRTAKTPYVSVKSPSVSQTPTRSSANTTTVASVTGPIIAAGIGAASIVVFIVAVVLVVVCCRRMSYRLRRNKKPVVPPQLVENSAYISVGNGIAASANNIPLYSKPMKGKHVISNGAGNNQQQLDSGYEEAPVVKPRESEYAEATLSPIRGLQDGVKPPATPPRPRSTARLSDGYEQATPSSDFKTPLADSSGYAPATAMTNSGYEDNFVTPAGSGYEENFVTPQTGIKESIRYDHLKRKLDLDGNDSMSEETDGRYGQVKPKSADSVKYQHLTHDRKPASADPSYGRLDKERKS